MKTEAYRTIRKAAFEVANQATIIEREVESTSEIADRFACGCEYATDKRGQEVMTEVCQEHEAEHIARHAAAVASCSHANRDLVESN